MFLQHIILIEDVGDQIKYFIYLYCHWKDAIKINTSLNIKTYTAIQYTISSNNNMYDFKLYPMLFI